MPLVRRHLREEGLRVQFIRSWRIPLCHTALARATLGHKPAHCLPPSAAACLNTFSLSVGSERDSERIERWPGMRQAGERGGMGVGGGVGHDRQERLLMDSSDSCDLLLKTRQVPPPRWPAVRRGGEEDMLTHTQDERDRKQSAGRGGGEKGGRRRNTHASVTLCQWRSQLSDGLMPPRFKSLLKTSDNTGRLPVEDLRQALAPGSRGNCICRLLQDPDKSRFVLRTQ